MKLSESVRVKIVQIELSESLFRFVIVALGIVRIENPNVDKEVFRTLDGRANVRTHPQRLESAEDTIQVSYLLFAILDGYMKTR